MIVATRSYRQNTRLPPIGAYLGHSLDIRQMRQIHLRTVFFPLSGNSILPIRSKNGLSRYKEYAYRLEAY